MRCQEAHPDFCADVTWSALSWDLLVLPLLVLCFVVCIVMPALSFIFVRYAKTSVIKSIRKGLGTVDTDEVRYPCMLNTCFALEVVLSLWFAGQWVARTYVHEVSSIASLVDQVLCVFFMITYLINAARNCFNISYVLQPSALVTVFTVVPTFVRHWDDKASWFSFSYLRIVNAVVAYEKLEKTGALRDVSEISRGYAVTLLRTLVLAVFLSGTTFSLEVLGDPEMFEDVPVTTEMGDISFIQMFYWIFTTISTVGYGDFSPTTTLSRLFIILAIIVGVYFFSTEVGKLVELHKMQSSGQGKFKPYQASSPYVVVIGGGVRGSSSVLKTFLEELYRDNYINRSVGWPNLSFMASAEQPTELREAIATLPKHARLRINYFMGDPTRHQDMERLRIAEATLVIIITDLQAANIEAEDTSNILRALAVKQAYPNVDLRLMLQKPAMKAKAVRCGIWPSRCFSINELKSALFALSCSIRGWSTLITHCLISEDDDEDEDIDEAEETWVKEFRLGSNFMVSGFIIASTYVGNNFLEFSRSAVKYGCTPIAIQIDGQVVLNPTDHIIKEDDVVFAVVPSHPDSLKGLEDVEMDWKQKYKEHQIQAITGTKSLNAMAFESDYTTAGGKEMWDTQGSSTALSGKPGSSPTNVRSGRPRGPPLRQGKSRMSGTASDVGSAVEEKLHEQIHKLEEQARKMAEAGGHHIMVVMAGNPWQQMQAFLRTLRQEHQPFFTPVIVLVHVMPSMSELKDIFFYFPKVAMMRIGSNPSVNDLLAAGMMTSRCIILFAGNSSESETFDRRMVDSNGVTMLAAIEGTLSEQATCQTHIVLELHRQESVKFMHRFPLYEDKYMTDAHNWAFNPLENFTNHPRFASGGLFTASCLGALVAKSLYTPGMVELLEALVLGDDGHSAQTSFPWQVAMPEGFSGRSFGDLQQEFLSPKKRALCVGLYRKCFSGTGSAAGYVVTNPDPSTALREDDLIIVLAPKTFGHDCYALGLLAGVERPQALDVSIPATTPLDAMVSVPEEGALTTEPIKSDVIPNEEAMPARSDLLEEVKKLTKLLAETQAREAGLRAQLRACQFPLPQHLETPRSQRGARPAETQLSSERLGKSSFQPSQKSNEFQEHFRLGSCSPSCANVDAPKDRILR